MRSRSSRDSGAQAAVQPLKPWLIAGLVGLIMAYGVLAYSVGVVKGGLIVLGVIMLGASAARPLWGISLTVALMPLEAVGRIVPGVAWLTLSKVVLIAALIGFVIQATRSRHGAATSSATTWLLATFTGAALASSVAAGFSLSGAVALASLLLHVAVFVLVVNLVSDRRSLRTVLGAIVLGSIPVVMAGLADAVTGRSALGTAQQQFFGSTAAFALGARRITATFHDPNALGRYVVFAIFVSLALFVFTRRRVVRAGIILLVSLDLFCLMRTSSRGSLAALVIAGAIALLWAAPMRYRLRAAALAVFALGSSLVWLRDTWSVVLARFTQGDIGLQRVPVWIDAAKLAYERPFLGWGWGNSAQAMSKFFGAPEAVHSMYLELAVSVGLPALALFVVMTARALTDGVRARSTDLTPTARLLAVAMVAILVNGVFLHSMDADEYWVALALLAALPQVDPSGRSLEQQG